jgi:type II secretory pathway component PulF
MGFIVAVLVANAVFLAVLQTAYSLVVRRRAKTYLLVEHLASLAARGLPFLSGLRALGQDLGGTFGRRVARLARHLEDGRTLGEALRASPRGFPPLLRGMIAAGEKGGNLPAFLEEIRKSYRRIAELSSQTVYAFLYPVILSIGVNIALTVLYVSVVPKLRELLRQSRIEPGVDYAGWWWRLLTANEIVLVLCLGGVLFILLGGTSAHFGFWALRFLKGVADRVALAVPVLGGVLRDAAVHQFALCGGLFLRAGAKLPEAARAAGEAERNGVLRRRWERVADRLDQGARLSEALRAEGGFPKDLAWFVETGEAAGSLADHLLAAAAHYETKSRFAAQVATRAVIPFFVILNGGLVLATFVLAYLPIMKSLKSVLPE